MSNTNTAVALAPSKALRPLDAAKQFLNDPMLKEQLKVACQKHMTPDRMARIALTAALSSPKLAECFTTIHGKASVAKALLTAAQRGLEVDGRQGHLVPFFSKVTGSRAGEKAMQATFIPGYQGLLDLAYNHPNVASIWVEVVREGDEFVYSKGLTPTLHHVPSSADDDGPLVATYAVCAMKSGAKVFVVLRRKDIEKIRAYSRGAAQADSVWNTNEEAMWKKSAIRALSKIIPQSPELREALSDDDEFERRIRDAVPVKAAVVDSAARAASDMLSAPTPASDPEPIHEPDGVPADPVPAAEPQLVTPQSELADLVVKTCNSDFDKFIALCESQGWLKNNRATEFSELPDAFTKKMLASKAALQALLTAAE